jgi:DNA-binding response OmpR family regulator
VLVCSIDESFSELVALNLTRRGFSIRRERWAACCDAGETSANQADVVIVDLDCPEPECWRGGTRARRRFPDCALVYLGHGWPATERLRAVQPCGYVRKPFGMGELLRVLGELTPVAQR